MKLYLLRHGETELNLQKVYYGSIDCALTAKGREQASGLTPIFAEKPLDLVLESPLIRAKETAAIVLGRREVKREIDDRLREIDFGCWEGKSWQQLQGDPLFDEWCRDWQNVRPPQGESAMDLAVRVGSFYAELCTRSEGNILIVAHHGVLQQLMACLLDADMTACWHYAFEQGTYTYLEVTDGFAVLKGHNLRL